MGGLEGGRTQAALGSSGPVETRADRARASTGRTQRGRPPTRTIVWSVPLTDGAPRQRRAVV